MPEVAARVEQAIADCVSEGQCTPDLGGRLSTADAGAAVTEKLARKTAPRVANE
jgi:3-isopropylmalate dehydrogenase